jgi:hypothetical protein
VLWEQQGLNLEQVLPGSKTPDAILALENSPVFANLGQISAYFEPIYAWYLILSSNEYFLPKY